MLRTLFNGALRAASGKVNGFPQQINAGFTNVLRLNFSTLQVQPRYLDNLKLSTTTAKPTTEYTSGLLSKTQSTRQLEIVRSVTKFSLNKGKRKTVKAVIRRFKRLHWGGWIRTRAGRNKRLHKKSKALKRRLRQHVFVNSTQSWLLDKMVTSFWRRPKYWIDDPYEPYNRREEFFATKSKPKF